MTVRFLRRTAASALVAAGMFTGLGVGAGTAAAETPIPMNRCWGISPYIVDQPYAPARLFGWQTEPGRIELSLPDVSSLWFFAGGYRSDVRLDWHNRNTGARGTVTDSVNVAYPGSGVARFDVRSGPGDVEFTVSAVNSIPLWAIPTTSCGGVVNVW
ncbi:hypothetical protein [Rhodococcus sp. NPDC058639]|uniref:hypothetical protein n=1 Tax=unclassified Rhodococcus (in: high G+C Gram-positive bacteria) TaxID=192944 RepID=UPI003654B1A1